MRGIGKDSKPRIVKALNFAPMSSQQLRDACGYKVRTIRSRLFELMDDGRVIRLFDVDNRKSMYYLASLVAEP